MLTYSHNEKGLAGVCLGFGSQSSASNPQHQAGSGWVRGKQHLTLQPEHTHPARLTLDQTERQGEPGCISRMMLLVLELENRHIEEE